MSYSFEYINIDDNSYIVQFKNTVTNKIVTASHFINLLNSSSFFRTVVNNSISRSKFPGLFFEGMPINNTNLNAPYFYFAIKTEFENILPDPTPFLKYFKDPTQKVSAFQSLSGNTLISPFPINYSKFLHIKTFCKYATPDVVDSFWKKIGQEAIKKLNSGTIWFKTHGHDVNYVHFRIQNNTKLFVKNLILKDVNTALNFYNGLHLN